jgi:hypothetical protein
MSTSSPIFTDSPRQHPNFIIGALHLFVWVMLHPTAFRNHLKTVNPKLEADDSWLFFLENRRWKKGKTIRFFLQSQILLPILATALFGWIKLLMGVPFSRLAVGMAVAVVMGILPSIISQNLAFSTTFGTVFGLAFGVVVGANNTNMAVVIGMGVASGVAINIAAVMADKKVFGLWESLIVAVMLCVSIGIGGRYQEGNASHGMALSVSLAVGVVLYHWLPYLLYPFMYVANGLLYLLDRLSIDRPYIFLRWHSVGWCERVPQAVSGLDKHLVLAAKKNPTLGNAAIDYVSTTKQQWAAQAAQVKLDAG